MAPINLFSQYIKWTKEEEAEFFGTLFKNIETANLTSKSKIVYYNRLKRLYLTGKSLEYVVLHPDKYVKVITSEYKESASAKTLFTSILTIFRHNPEFKCANMEAYNKWFAAFEASKAIVEERYRQNQPSEAQERGYVEWREIVKKRNELPNGSIERLLLAMYSDIPPLRGDFNRVFIYTDPEIPKDHEDNYLHHLPEKTTLVLNEHKTSKVYVKEPYNQVLPAVLVAEINASLKERPRDWLFVKSKKDEPFTPELFALWVKKIFTNIFKKPLSISLIRHSYINTLDFNKMTVAEKEDIAWKMAHSASMQDRYRLFFNKDRSGVGGQGAAAPQATSAADAASSDSD